MQTRFYQFQFFDNVIRITFVHDDEEKKIHLILDFAFNKAYCDKFQIN